MTRRVGMGMAIVISLVSGCATLTERVEERLRWGDIPGARALLGKEGADGVSPENLNKDAVAARDKYADAVANVYVGKAEDELRAGKARSALSEVTKGCEACPWSERLSAAKQVHADRVAQLDRLAAQLQELQGDELDDEQSRHVLEATKTLAGYTADTPVVDKLRSIAKTSLVKAVARRIEEGCRDMSEPDRARVRSDIALVYSTKSVLDRLDDAVGRVAGLPQADSKPVVTPELEAQINGLLSLIREAGTAARPSHILAPCWVEVIKHFDRFCSTEFPTYLEQPDAGFAAICLAEAMHGQMASVRVPTFESSLAHAHLQRARTLVGSGKVAALALLHIRRARQLEGAAMAAELEGLTVTAEASLGADLPIMMTISLDGDPNIDTEYYDLLRNSLARSIVYRTGRHWKWQWKSPNAGAADVRIYFNSGQLVRTRWEDLTEVVSSYLSHYEDVPNPQKSFLKLQLDSQRFAVDLAESSYDSAVSSHNIYPTEYSLMNVNSCRTRYNIAVNTYNSLVEQYNLTPSTVSQPVFLPYTFRQGTVASGCTAKVTVKVGEEEQTITEKSVDTDFVRFGTNYKDADANYRRDDSLDISLSVDRLVEHLITVNSRTCRKMGDVLGHVPIEVRTKLCDSERNLLCALLHPFRDSSALSVQIPNDCTWAKPCMAEIRLPLGSPRPPVLALTAPVDWQPGTDAKSLASAYEPLVCLVQSSFSSGSGVLISADGAILTCAHVLLGTDMKASFSSGSLKGDYPIEVVFVHEQQDVAVVRATGLRSERFAPVRLGSSLSKGDRIVAMGNPGLSDQAMSIAAISEGIVSNPQVQLSEEQERLIADITIASGSSGGPLISMDTGEVVGVVTHVIQEGIRQGGVSSSGFSCAAAPAARLTAWLGLAYGN